MKKSNKKVKKFYYKEQTTISALAQFNTELDEHIGKRVRFKKPTCIAEKEEYMVRHMQKDFTGNPAFNLIGTTEKFMGKGWLGSASHQMGKCADPDDVYFVDEKK